ncbi:chorismate--pyruvate lyase family protein [Micromonospora sp. NPDC092111]|uniref:chorismate--pyruvate lyase family protein n=1 Tax=Micromonospora sp. NPDC092111 TaxID=3364289 RepID=UPI00381FCE6C
MLEEYAGERIVTARLVQPADAADPGDRALLRAGPDAGLLTRTTDLVGIDSRTVYVRAHAVIALDALPEPLRTALCETEEPIGRLLRQHRTESFRELVDGPRTGPAGARRRYRIFTGGVPTFLISETFLPACFAAENDTPDRGRTG